jgi:AbrB family looped-hinge helix DNA binding protein
MSAPFLLTNPVRRGTSIRVLAKITSKRQVTFPAAVLAALGVGPGDHLEILDSPDGFLLRPRRVDHSRLAPLAGMLKKGVGSFDLNTFRNQAHDPSLRD